LQNKDYKNSAKIIIHGQTKGGGVSSFGLKLEQRHSVIFTHIRSYNAAIDIFWVKAIQPRPITDSCQCAMLQSPGINIITETVCSTCDK